jgi:hypothetical protein
MIENEMIQLISNVGFPIVITVYLILKFEKTIEGNTLALQALKDIIRAKR